MFLEIAAGAFLLADFIYHRFNEDEPVQKPGPIEVGIPRTDEGAPVPMLFGRTLVRQPVLAWAYCTNVNGTTSANVIMFFVVAIGCDDGNGTNQIHGMRFGDDDVGSGWTQDGEGLELTTVGTLGVVVETLDGRSTQILADDGDTFSNAPTYAGRAMIAKGVPHSEIGGYRGYLSITLLTIAGGGGGEEDPFGGWAVEQGSATASVAFDASSQHTSHAHLATYGQVGYDMNVANAIYLLLVQKFGAAGIDSSKIDITTFQACQYVLRNEGQGCSMVIDQSRSADEYIQALLRQADACIDENPATGKIEMRLVRADFDPNDIDEINRSNTVKLLAFAAGGWTDVVNKIRVLYTNRADKYQDGSVAAHNQGNSTAQSSDEEQVIDMPYVHEKALAQAIANRELQARSRPLTKFRAMCGRWAIRLMRGDPVRVVWSNPDIAGRIFRVANVERGTLEDGAVAVDLVEDFNYTHRNKTPRPPIGGGVDHPPIVLGG